MEREASSSPSPLSPQTSSDRQDASDEPNESNQGAKGLGARGSSIENLQKCKRFAKQSQICSIEDRSWTRIQLSYNTLTETIKRNDGEFVLLVALRRTCSTNVSETRLSLLCCFTSWRNSFGSRVDILTFWIPLPKSTLLRPQTIFSEAGT